MNIRKVRIQTGARLHFGPLSFRVKVGPEFGGLGMTICNPGFEVTLETSSTDEIQSSDDLKQPIQKIVADVRRKLEVEDSHGIHIKVLRAIPRHVGLGSGTQLGLAVAKGVAVLLGFEKLSITDLARLAGRGRRSAIGIHGFQQGGLLVDEGKEGDDEIGSLSRRLDFPEDWRVLLVIPKDRQGIFGEREGAVFDYIKPMESSTSAELRALIETTIIPSVERCEFENFASALTSYGKIVGAYFSRYQGGVFSIPNASKVCDILDSHGVFGYGQSSWGPTLWVLQRSEQQATALEKVLSRNPVFREFQFRVVKPLNTGAQIELI